MKFPSAAVAVVVGTFWSVGPGFAGSPDAGSPERRPSVTGRLAVDGYIRSILQRRIDQERRGVGMAVGVLDTNGCRVVTYGQSGNLDRPQVDGDTLFEIGSITKTFTAALLADMVKRGEVSLDTTLRECLPARLRLPSPGPGDITLRQLATHSSGLPRMPELPAGEQAEQALSAVLREVRHHVRRQLGKEVPPKAVAWVHATRGETFAYLERCKVNPFEPHQPEYSNLGVSVLGEALAQKAQRSYEALLTERVLLPLGMTNTCVHVPPAWEPFFAAGHDDTLEPAPRLNIPDLPGAGALSSSVNDMLKYLAANLEQKPPIDPSLHHVMAASESTTMGLNWIIGRGKNKDIIWHNGGTQGYASFIGFNPKAGTGVVVLSNVGALVDDIGLHLLAPQQFELGSAPPRESPFALDLGVGRWLVPAVCVAVGLFFLLAPIEGPGRPCRRRWFFGKPMRSRLELAECVLATLGVALFSASNMAAAFWGPVLRVASLVLLVLVAVRCAVKARGLPWFNQWSRLQWLGHGLVVAFLLMVATLNLALFVFFL